MLLLGYAISLCARYAMLGTDVAITLRACYVMPVLSQRMVLPDALLHMGRALQLEPSWYSPLSAMRGLVLTFRYLLCGVWY